MKRINITPDHLPLAVVDMFFECAEFISFAQVIPWGAPKSGGHAVSRLRCAEMHTRCSCLKELLHAVPEPVSYSSLEGKHLGIPSPPSSGVVNWKLRHCREAETLLGRGARGPGGGAGP